MYLLKEKDIELNHFETINIMRSILKNEELIEKALSILVVENALLEIKNQIYEHVVNLINKKYHCGLTDCFEHPEYLRFALKSVSGDSYHDIVKSIKEQLDEFSHKKPIVRFVEEISK